MVSRAIERVLVIGAGTMGTQIAAVFACAGLIVAVADIDEGALGRSSDEASRRLRRLGDKGEIEDAGAVIARLEWGTDLARFASSADFVLEAAAERLDIKRALFDQVGRIAPAHAILATNSSTIPSSRIADASGRPDRVCNVHFFNPALVMECVEVVPNPSTSAETLDAVIELCERIGKKVVRLQKEVPGFVANRLMNAIQDEATRLYAEGVAGIEDIDLAAASALAHPMGPFALMDLVGLDVIRDMHLAEAELTGDASRLPQPALLELIESGRLGRKTGRGWHDHTKEPV